MRQLDGSSVARRTFVLLHGLLSAFGRCWQQQPWGEYQCVHACCKLLAAFRVALVLERNNAVELKPSMEDMFDAVRKVCEDIIAITDNLPRLALPGTARQLKELEVGWSSSAACIHCVWPVHRQQPPQPSRAEACTACWAAVQSV